MTTATAYCWANGAIEIGPACPKGALPLVQWEEKELADAIQALAVLGWNGESLLPKNPAWIQAIMENDIAAISTASVDSLVEFRARLQETLNKGTFKQQ